MKVLYVPTGSPLSSYSSESATATVPTASSNSERLWSSTLAHQSLSAKLQPAHSVTPLSGSSKPGTPLSSIIQPSGAVLVQTSSPGTDSSTFGPRGSPSKSSVKTMAFSLGRPLTSILSIAHHQSLPASNMPNVRTTLVAPGGGFKSRTTVSFSLSRLSGLKFGLLGSDNHKSNVIPSPPS